MTRTSKMQKVWQKIAIAFETPAEQRTPRQKGLTRFGLCYAWYACTGRNQSPESAVRRLLGEEAFIFGCYIAPILAHERDADLIRSGVASLFAAMSDRERAALGGSRI